MLVRRGYLVSEPTQNVFNQTMPCEKGLYLQGYKGSNLILAAGETTFGHNALTLSAERAGTIKQIEMPATYTGKQLFTWAQLGGKIYATNGGAPLYYDPASWEWAAVPFGIADALETASKSYLVDPLRCGALLVHMQRIFYLDMKNAQMSVSAAVNPSDSEDPSVIVGGRLTYKPSQFLWSEPGRPGAVQAFAYGTVDDGEARILNGFSTGSGPDAALVVFADRGIWLLQGYDPASRIFTTISRGVGMLAQHSLASYRNSALFLGTDNVYTWSSEGGLRALGNLERYFLGDSDVEWRPNQNAVGAVGSRWPYYMLTDPAHGTVLAIDLETEVEAVFKPAQFPNTLIGMGASGVTSKETDLIGGTRYSQLGPRMSSWSWERAGLSGLSAEWTLFGPISLDDKSEAFVRKLVVIGNTNSGTLWIRIFSGENAHMQLEDAGAYFASANGPFVWDGSIKMGGADTSDEMVLLETEATTGPMLLETNAAAPETKFPRLHPNVHRSWYVQPSVTGRTFYVAIRFEKKQEAMVISDIAIELEAA